MSKTETTSTHVDFNHIRYLNNIPLTVHCLQLELKCDYETANIFAEWHFKHLQHMFSVLLADSRFDNVHKENMNLKKENAELKEKLNASQKEKLADKIESTPVHKRSFWRMICRIN